MLILFLAMLLLTGRQTLLRVVAGGLYSNVLVIFAPYLEGGEQGPESSSVSITTADSFTNFSLFTSMYIISGYLLLVDPVKKEKNIEKDIRFGV